MLNIKKEERRGTSSFKNNQLQRKPSNTGIGCKQHQFSTPINGNIETKIFFHCKAKDPTSPDDKKKKRINNSTMNHLPNNRRQPIPSRSFHANKTKINSDIYNQKL